MGGRLLERSSELEQLASAARRALRGDGVVVLVHGEAGIGKSSLVRTLPAQLPSSARMLVGYCDAMSTPRTLGPLRDLVPSVGEGLAAALERGEREDVLGALRQELVSGPPAVLVVEDVHWADEATLDVLRYLIRRIGQLPTALVLTYRDDELERDHPLGALLGDLPGTDVRRIAPARLSRAAVAELSAGEAVDAGAVYALTSGNPYFVTEVIASARQATVPPTVVDAVHARLRRLAGPVQDLVERLAVIPGPVPQDLVEAVSPDGWPRLAAAEARGLLTVSPEAVAFRHELTRRAVVDALPVSRRMELNAAVLRALEARGERDLGRLVHHAEEAGDGGALARYAPRAAREAVASGAHREAVAHYRRAIAHADGRPGPERAALLEECAVELYTVGRGAESVEVQRQAVAVRRALGDATALGASLRWLSRMQWFAGERPPAEASAAEAVRVLEPTRHTGLLALAVSNQSQLAMLASDSGRAIPLALRAVALARQAKEPAALSHALNNLGTSLLCRGDTAGRAHLEEAVWVAREVGDHENALRAYVNLAWENLDQYRVDEAETWLEEGLTLALEAEFLAFWQYLTACRARLEVERSNWSAATRLADTVPTTAVPAYCVALTVMAAAQTRTGDPAARTTLTRAREVALPLGEIQRLGMVAVVEAEEAWLRGDDAGVAAVAAPTYEEAVRLDHFPLRAELAYRLRLVGQQVPEDVLTPLLDPLVSPFALQAVGRWKDAALAWRDAGCPYQEAEALAASTHQPDLVRALHLADDLGAAPLARRVRARMQRQGVRVPRGSSPATRSNPAGLTARQAAVLELVARGLTNAEIAERLVLSVRTVDSHVAAVLLKLGVASRRDAARRAQELGLADLSSR